MTMPRKPIFATLGVSKHKIPCIIGIHPTEREQLQEVWVDIQVETDISKSLKSNKIDDTVDYTRLADICTELASIHCYHLLETFAHDVIQKVFEEFDVNWVWIKIKKPFAITTGEFAFVELKEYKRAD